MSTYLSLKGLREQGVDVQLAAYRRTDGGPIAGEDFPVRWCTEPWHGKAAYSPRLKRELKAVEGVDIYHAQGVWQYPTYALTDIARHARKPYLITPRGMLYPQDIKKSNAFVKRLSLRWRLLRDMNNAACVHVTCREEMNHCRALGVRAPIAVIPNPVDVLDYPRKILDGIFRVGYLGRLTPRKNVEALIRAFAELPKDGTQLLIIGGGDALYEQFLREEARRLGVENIRFTGFLNGKEKDEALSSLSMLVMPSEFENMGNVVLEALVRGIPCLATKGSPWKDLQDNSCGWWTDYSQHAITAAIKKAMSMSGEQLMAMGANGLRLVRGKYATEVVAGQLHELYNWVLNHHDRPSFVYT